MGWKVSGLANLVKCLNNAPCAVSSGGAIKSLFKICLLNILPTKFPIAVDSTYPSTPVIWPAKYKFLLLFNLKNSSNSLGELMKVFLCKPPSLANSAFCKPGIRQIL